MVTDNWVTQHRYGASPVKSGRFLALVSLPGVNVVHSELDRFVAAEDPNQGSTPLLSGRNTWSCAQWVIRTLQKIQTKGWFCEEPVGNLADRDAFYAHINLKAAYFIVGMKRGIMTADFVGSTVEGVHVLTNAPVGHQYIVSLLKFNKI